MKKIISVLFLIISLLGSSFYGLPTQAYADSPGYTKIDLGSLGGGNTKAYGINNTDQIVGQSNINATDHHAFLWEDGNMTDLGTLGGTNSIAWGINNHGQIVGESQTSSNSATHAFLWENGVMTNLGAPQEMIDSIAHFPPDLHVSVNSSAHGINENGHIVGDAKVSITHPSIRKHAVLWKDGEIIDLQNDMTNVTTFLFTDSAIESYANAINDSDQVVGSMTFPPQPDHNSLYLGLEPQEAFLWENGLITVLGQGRTARTEASDINNSGDFTLTSAPAPHPGGGFVSGGGRGQASEAIALNNSGQILGVKAELGGPELGQGYFIGDTDFGEYPNQDFSILGGEFIKGGINDDGSGVVDNIFFKKDQITPTLTDVPTPTPTEIPTPTPYNNGYNSGYNSGYNNNYKASTGTGMYFNTNYNNGWNSNYNSGWIAPF